MFRACLAVWFSHSALPPPEQAAPREELALGLLAPGVAIRAQILDLSLQDFNCIPQAMVVFLQQFSAVCGITQFHIA